jgi:hypothetical protein
MKIPSLKLYALIILYASNDFKLLKISPASLGYTLANSPVLSYKCPQYRILFTECEA